MEVMDRRRKTGSAHLILDKPLVAQRVDVDVEAGQRYAVILRRYLTQSDLAYVVLVDGVVVDQNEIIQPNTEIRCALQIVGG